MVQSNENDKKVLKKLPVNIKNREKVLEFVSRYIIFPVENGAVRITLYIDDKQNIVKTEEMVINK